MCHVITATLPAKVDPQRVRSVIDRHEWLLFRPLQNPFVLAQLSKGETYYHATKGHCDCGTIMGGANPVRLGRAKAHARTKADKLRRQGWTESKVERWMTQQGFGERLRTPSYHSSPEARMWLSFISDLLCEARVRHIGLLVHWTALPTEEEPVRILRFERHTLSAVDAAFLARMEEDVLYRVTPD